MSVLTLAYKQTKIFKFPFVTYFESTQFENTSKIPGFQEFPGWVKGDNKSFHSFCFAFSNHVIQFCDNQAIN